MPIDARVREQANLILDNLEGAAAFPPRDQWEGLEDFDYLYREYTILTREQDADRVGEAIRRILNLPTDTQDIRREKVLFTRGIVRFMVPPTETLVPDILRQLDDEFGPGVATPDHILYVSPSTCPATEPIVPPTDDVHPVPPPGLNARCCRRPCRGVPPPECDGDGVFISIVDTGLIPEVAADHFWLAGVDGTPEDPYGDLAGETVIVPYAGHGTFVAGVARCMAPKASAYVERAFDIAGANYESMLPASMNDALNRNPDILEFTFCTTTRGDQSLITFDDFFDTRIRQMKGLLVVAPAGNDHSSRLTWPAAYPEVLSVGALSTNWRNRAHFSNHGRWVDVYAPGENLINAFPVGTYVCVESPNIGVHRVFEDGMAVWSGTSFSTPVVAGLIAARMSSTGENAVQAAQSLMRLACSQAVPGIGPVLYPGQACCKEDCGCR